MRCIAMATERSRCCLETGSDAVYVCEYHRRYPQPVDDVVPPPPAPPPGAAFTRYAMALSAQRAGWYDPPPRRRRPNVFNAAHPQCAGATVDGGRCRQWARTGSRYCAIHRDWTPKPIAPPPLDVPAPPDPDPHRARWRDASIDDDIPVGIAIPVVEVATIPPTAPDHVLRATVDRIDQAMTSWAPYSWQRRRRTFARRRYEGFSRMTNR